MKKLLILMALLLFVGGTVFADTYTVRVKKLQGSAPEYRDIMIVPNDLVLSPGDQVEVVVDSNIWCPGGTLGTVDITVPTNTCGFTATTYTVDEPAAMDNVIQAIAGAVDDTDLETLVIELLLTDADCTAEFGAGAFNSCELRIYCNRDIPTLSEWGLIIFSLLILSLITVVMTRRKRAAARA